MMKFTWFSGAIRASRDEKGDAATVRGPGGLAVLVASFLASLGRSQFAEFSFKRTISANLSLHAQGFVLR